MLAAAPKAAEMSSDLRGPLRIGPARGARMIRYGSAFIGNAEPPLTEVMDDPIVRGLMARDGVVPESLQTLIDEIRGRLR